MMIRHFMGYYNNNVNFTFHISLACSFYLQIEESLSPIGPVSDKLLFGLLLCFILLNFGI